MKTKLVVMSMLFIPCFSRALSIPLMQAAIRSEVCSSCFLGKKYLVFTAPDMNKSGQNPDTSFANVYTGSNFNLQAWSMKKSMTDQQEISLMFGLPDDVNVQCPLALTLYFFVSKNEGSSGSAVNVRIRADTKATLEEIGGNFASVLSTGDVHIVEPSTNQTLENLIVKIPFSVSGMQPQNWLLLVLDRIGTLFEEEYSKDIYLTSIVISYFSRGAC